MIVRKLHGKKNNLNRIFVRMALVIVIVVVDVVCVCAFFFLPFVSLFFSLLLFLFVLRILLSCCATICNYNLVENS